MPLIEWKQDFCTGHPEVDAQHQQWVAIYNDAHDRMMATDSDTFVSTGIDALRKMNEYGKYHFAREEEIMAAYGVSGLTRHRKIHQLFSSEIEQMIEDMEAGTHILNSEIIKRIENWLVHHILKEDRILKNALIGKSPPG